MNCFVGRFDEGLHDMKGTLASLFAAPQHACIFNAHSLGEERSVSRITGHSNNQVTIYLRERGMLHCSINNNKQFCKEIQPAVSNASICQCWTN